MDKMHFQTHMRSTDLTTNMVYLDSTSICPIKNDNLTKSITISNVLVTEYSHIPDKSIVLYLLVGMKSDNGKRTAIINLENITF